MKRITLLVILLCLLGSPSSCTNPQAHTAYLPPIANSHSPFSNFRVGTFCGEPAQTTFLQGQPVYVSFDLDHVKTGEISFRFSVTTMPYGPSFQVYFPPKCPFPYECTITGPYCGPLAEGLAPGLYEVECVAMRDGTTDTLIGKFSFTVE